MRPTFYRHQTSGTCAGVCTCDRKHQMQETGTAIFFLNEWSYKTILLKTVSFRVSKFQFVFEWLSTIAWNPAHLLGKKQGTWLYTVVWNRGQCKQLTNSKENYLPWYRGCWLIIWFPWLLFFYLSSFISFTLLPILDIYMWKSELLCS